MIAPPPRVFGLGMCSPLGLDAEVNQVEIAAGTVNFAETTVLDPMGTPVRASMLNLLPRERKRTARMAALGVRAVRDCLRELDLSRRWELPLFLGLPAPKSGGLVDAAALLARLQKGVGLSVRLMAGPERLFPLGRAAFFSALDAACGYVTSGAAPLALVGAVDSMCDVTSLTYLSLSGRTLGELNPDGLIPAEAAAFALIGREGVLPMPPDRALRVVARSTGHEARHFQQKEPNLGEGLTRVLRPLRQEAEAGRWRADYLFSCQTGESFWAKEFVMGYLRNASLFPDPLRTQAGLVAEWLGDVGAASGASLLVAAEGWLRKRAAESNGPRRVLIYGCSDEGPIGACVVEGN